MLPIGEYWRKGRRAAYSRSSGKELGLSRLEPETGREVRQDLGSLVY